MRSTKSIRSILRNLQHGAPPVQLRRLISLCRPSPLDMLQGKPPPCMWSTVRQAPRRFTGELVFAVDDFGRALQLAAQLQSRRVRLCIGRASVYLRDPSLFAGRV
jgi:hypothetical protein